MFLVPTFYENVKNDPYILQMVKKNPINFSVNKNDPVRFFIFIIIEHSFLCRFLKNYSVLEKAHVH
jgi:hypothetical protein